MILDCHVHGWKYPDHFVHDFYFNKVVAHTRGQENMEEAKKHADRQAPRILASMDEAGIDRSLVIGMKSVKTLGIEVPNEFLADQVKPHSDRLSWACCVDMSEPDALSEVEHCVKGLGAVALGEIGPAYCNYRLDDRRCYPVYEVVRSLDVPLLIHAGPTLSSNAYHAHSDLVALDTLCVDFPELKVVLCHFGEPNYEEAAHLLIKHPNLFADISMMTYYAGVNPNRPARVTAPHLHLDYPLLYYFSQPARDTDKLIFGSDMENPKAALDGFGQVNGRLEKMGMPSIPKDAFHRMFHENWKRVFTKIS